MSSSINKIVLKQLLDNQDEVKNFQYQIYRPDNTIVWVEENTRAVRDRDKNLLYYEGIIQEITQRKEQEQALLRQVKEMQIAIDKSQQKYEVARIVNTDSFQQVKQRIKKLKN